MQSNLFAVAPVKAEEKRMPLQDSAQSFDFTHIRATFWRNRWLALGIVAICVLLALGLTLMATKKYSATGSLQIEEPPAPVLGTEDGNVSRLNDIFMFLQTQVDIVESRFMAERVAAELRLGSNQAFLNAMQIDQDELPPPGHQRAAKIASVLQDGLTVELPRNSQIVRISFESPDSRISAAVVNGYLDAFVRANLARRADSSNYARQFLEEQLVEARQQLEDSERAALAYARQVGLLDTSSSGTAGGSENGMSRSSLTASNLMQFNDALNEAQKRRIDAEERWRSAASAPLMSLPQVQANVAIQQLQQERATAQSQYLQERELHTDEYPTTRRLKRSVAALDQQMQKLARETRDAIREEYESARLQEAALSSRVSQLRGATLAERDRSVQYNILKRQADTNRGVYDSLLQRLREVSQESRLVNNNVTLLDRANPPVVPSSPRPLINLLLGLLIGTGLAGLAVLLRERVNDRLSAPADVDARLGLPLLGIIPKIAEGTDVLTEIVQPRSAPAEAYSALASTLRLNLDIKHGTVLLVTSSSESEGKSTTSFSLARSFASMGIRTIAIDGDMRRPSLHKFVGALSNRGTSDILSGQAGYEDVLIAGKFDFIPAGKLPANPPMLLASDALPQLLATLRHTYQLIIIDSPPVMGLADAPIYGSHADLTIMVVEAQKTSIRQSRDALRRLQSNATNVLGAVLSKFDANAIGYGKDYGYAYYSYSSRDGAAADAAA